MNAHAFNCITSVAPSVAHIMGFEPPKTAGAANRALLELQQKALGGRKATRALLYNPDAIAHHLFARYTDDFLPVLRHAPLALPMQSVMPSVTPVCFASMYTGALPEVHGIRAYVKPVLTTDTLFDAALRAGLRPAIVSTAGDSISRIFLERAMDYFIYDTVEEVNEKAEQLIAADEYDLLVVYNGDYDATMHRFSPESAEALAALRGNVAEFDRLCTLAREHWTAHDALVAFAPDHGCHPIDGSLGYRQYIAVMDSLVQWEHDILGFTKYNRQPKNRTFAYVNYTYYMFQGGLGVSFHRDQESRVLNCNKLVNGDDDAIWGLSHEWGHQHQMHPYFCWKGVNEVSNNMNSYYNIMKMGYRTSDKINHWPNARRHFLDDETYTDIDKDGHIIYDATTSQIREACYTEAMKSKLDWNPDYKALAIDARNITKVVDNKLRARTINEVGVGETLCPFIMLYVYFTKNGCPDFGPDLYESLRQMSQDGGSTVEKTGGYDKYELVAMAQNNNANDALAKLNELYPTSVWCNYITEEHHGTWENNMPYILNFIRKTSRLSGYNLFPYFEKWGFLRQVATYIGDYGNGFQIFPEAAYNEFKADMDALVDAGVLRPLSDEKVIEISNTDDMFMGKPTFPN